MLYALLEHDSLLPKSCRVIVDGSEGEEKNRDSQIPACLIVLTDRHLALFLVQGHGCALTVLCWAVLWNGILFPNYATGDRGMKRSGFDTEGNSLR